MALTPVDKVYYAEPTTPAKLDTITATMASSIENGIGKRLALQEIAVGCKLGMDTTYQIPGGHNFYDAGIVPVKVVSGFGSFNQGMTVNNGIVTVNTPGMYIVTSSIGIGIGGGRSIVINLYQNSVMVAGSEQPTAASFINAQSNSVLQCKAGDTIYMKARAGAGTTPVTSAANFELTYLSVAMVQALPTV